MGLLNQIKKTFEVSHHKQWYETYWAFDIHGTLIKPTYDLNNQLVEYYPFAKEALQLLTERDDIKMILYTCSYPHEIEMYLREFEKDEIFFDHVNKNPGISSNMGNFGYYEEKFYFNVLFEDKAGFDPTTEWEEIFNYLVWCKENNYLPDPKWTTKF